MKILHINDLAGVAGALCKYLRKAGHEADVISWMDDSFGFDKFYGYKAYKDQSIMRAFLRQRIPQYDILHLHFPFTFLEWLYQFEKPIVMHYHGTDIAMNTADARMLDHKCKAILVAGEQLKQYHPRAQVLPTIVDTDHFKPMPEITKQGGHLTFDISYLQTVRTGVGLTARDRNKEAIPYKDLPAFLNKFHSYIDVRIHKTRGPLTDMSKTGLEALACGLGVYSNKEWHHGLPDKHKPENVTEQLIKYYEAVLCTPLKTSKAVQRMDWMF